MWRSTYALIGSAMANGLGSTLMQIRPCRSGAPGFVHGFYVQSDMATVLYKCTDYYRPEFERTINWADLALAISWPLIENTPPILSDKDRQAPFINSLI